MRIGIDIVDKDHDALVALHAQITRLLQATTLDTAAIGYLLEQYKSALISHFFREEALIKAAGYPLFLLLAHKQQHDFMIVAIGGPRSPSSAFEDSVIQHDYVHDRLLEHIRTLDAEYAGYILNSKQTVLAA